MVSITKKPARKTSALSDVDFSLSLETYKADKNINQIIIGSEGDKLKFSPLFHNTNFLFEGPSYTNAQVIINIYDLLKLKRKTEIEVFCFQDSFYFEDLLVKKDEIVHSDAKTIEAALIKALNGINERKALYHENKELFKNFSSTDSFAIKIIVISGFLSLSKAAILAVKENISLCTALGYFIILEEEREITTGLSDHFASHSVSHLSYLQMTAKNVAQYERKNESKVRHYPLNIIKEIVTYQKGNSYMENLESF